MDMARVFTAADRNGRLSKDEYEFLCRELEALTDNIKTPNIRAVLHPKATSYPNYSVQQGQYEEESVTTGRNRQNSQQPFPDKVIPIRLYHVTSGGFIPGLVDEYINIGNIEIFFVTSTDFIVDPVHPDLNGYVKIPIGNINTLALAAMNLEQVVKARTEAFFEEEDRAADITVSFYTRGKNVTTTTDVLIAIDFTIM